MGVKISYNNMASVQMVTNPTQHPVQLVNDPEEEGSKQESTSKTRCKKKTKKLPHEYAKMYEMTDVLSFETASVPAMSVKHTTTTKPLDMGGTGR